MPDDPEAEKFVKAVEITRPDGLYAGDRIGITVNSDFSLAVAVIGGIVGGLLYLVSAAFGLLFATIRGIADVLLGREIANCALWIGFAIVSFLVLETSIHGEPALPSNGIKTGFVLFTASALWYLWAALFDPNGWYAAGPEGNSVRQPQVYDRADVIRCALFCSPALGGSLCARNWRALGNKRGAWRCAIWPVLLVVWIPAGAFVSGDMVLSMGLAVTLVGLSVIVLFESRRQGNYLAARYDAAPPALRKIRFEAVVGLLAWAGLFLMGLPSEATGVVAPSRRTGISAAYQRQAIEFGDGETMYYDVPLKEADARTIRDVIQATGDFGGKRLQDVLSQQDKVGTIVVKLLMEDAAWNDPVVLDGARRLAKVIEERVHRRVEVQLCDKSLLVMERVGS